ncbi:MAG: type IV secretory system conjugative DNA transfer family protein [Sphingorhabdus sp.]
MSIDLWQRIHAFWHSLFGQSDLTEARTIYAQTSLLLKQQNLHIESGRKAFANRLINQLCKAFDCSSDTEQAQSISVFVHRMFDFEGWFLLPAVDWSQQHSISQLWDIRDAVLIQKRFLDDPAQTEHLILNAIYAMMEPIFGNETEAKPDPQGIIIPTTLLHTTPKLGEAIDAVIGVPEAEELLETGLFDRLGRNITRNVIRASGGNPDDPDGYRRAVKLPSKSDVKDPATLVDNYLGGTPLHDLMMQPVDFTIPTKSRFEHHHIVAGTGHGKTQPLQYLISQDLEAVAAGERTVIVIDSQGDLISNISKLAVFASGGALHDKITIIDPEDVEYPVSLNMFDVGVERLQKYDMLERERLTNSILELYDFVLGSLLDAGMTQKQNVIFRYVTRLMLHIPGATIHTLRELMEPGAEKKFAEHIEKLSGSARHFFDTEFAGREFVQTKQQVLRRLWGILENQTFERMFSHPHSKLDLFTEMNEGRVILINTAKSLLKEQGTQIFGRFFIALIAQAAQERSTLPKSERMPTLVYVDEAQDYFDQNIGIILAQARKYNVGMVLAHQFLGQLDPKLQEAFSANTSIKFAGGVSARDARTLAPMLFCEPGLIEAQSKGTFVAMVKGVNKAGLPLSFPFGHMEKMDQMKEGEREALQAKMRDRYAVHISSFSGSDDEADDDANNDADDRVDEGEPGKPDPSPKGPKPSSGGGAASPNTAKPKTNRKPGADVSTEPGKQW